MLDFELDAPEDDLLLADDPDNFIGFDFLTCPDLPELDLVADLSFRDFLESFIFPDDFVELLVLLADRFLSD